MVAPFAGAWIEIIFWFREMAGVSSLPSRERGLKSSTLDAKYDCSLSLPSRERGLKLMVLVCIAVMIQSLPSRERGLKWQKKPKNA